MGYGDELEEVNVQIVRLRTVGLPVAVHRGVAEGGDAATGLVGADGPGGEGGDVFEVRWEGSDGRVWKDVSDSEMYGRNEQRVVIFVPTSTGGDGMSTKSYRSSICSPCSGEVWCCVIGTSGKWLDHLWSTRQHCVDDDEWRESCIATAVSDRAGCSTCFILLPSRITSWHTFWRIRLRI